MAVARLVQPSELLRNGGALPQMHVRADPGVKQILVAAVARVLAEHRQRALPRRARTGVIAGGGALFAVPDQRLGQR